VIRRIQAICCGIAMTVLGATVEAQEPIRLYAAGSLKPAMNELAAAWTQAGGRPVAGEFGASGLLRDRIAKGERADVFASANLEHPQSLARDGRLRPVVLFARNRLCALASPKSGVTTANLLDRMLDATVVLGTSTPKADPSGDYAWQLFEKAEALRPGSFAALSTKAKQLTGGPDSPPPPPDRSVYGVLVAEGKADVFLTYCTNALAARRENPTLQVIDIPATLAVGADYGLAVAPTAQSDAHAFALFILSEQGQRILARQGFTAPNLP
jgi:ABC-type molybdate transport system substrate-binding protein